MSNKISFEQQIFRAIFFPAVLIFLAIIVADMWHEQRQQYTTLERTLTFRASMLAANLSSATLFEDSESAKETLASLAHQQSVGGARLFLADGRLLAEYLVGDGSENLLPPSNLEPGIHEQGELMLLALPIQLHGKNLGMLAISADLLPLQEALYDHLVMDLLSLIIVAFVAFATARLLKSRLAAPLQELATLAEKVRNSSDFSLRVPEFASSELDQLASSLNSMLERIAERDRLLADHRMELEGEVTVRTIELRNSEQRYRRLVEDSPQAILVLSRNRPSGTARAIIYANPAALTMFGLAKAELIPGLLSFPALVAPGSSALFESVFEQQVACTGEYQLLLRSGEPFDAELAMIPFDDDNNGLATLLIIRNISVQKANEQAIHKAREVAEEASRAKSNFLANMSHEIRTPMNGIIGLTDLALEEECSATLRGHLEGVHGSAHSLLAIINDILDLSKIEAGKLALEEAEFSLGKLLSTLLYPLRMRAIEKGLMLDCVLPDDLLGHYVGDPTRLYQVLNNLLGNAIKFTERGGVQLRLSSNPLTADRMLLHFVVGDSGPGVAPEIAETIFEPFEQGDRSITRHYGGTGLGLSISRKLADMLGGALWVVSPCHGEDNYCPQMVGSGVGSGGGGGAGSCFHFTATLRVAASDTLDSERSQQIWSRQLSPSPRTDFITTLPESRHIPAAALTILLAEDQEINRRLVLHRLHKWGFKVLLAENGYEALDLWEHTDVDIILMDIQMPLLDGISATLELRRREQQRQRRPTKIIALTANALKGDRERYLAAGMDGYLAKPLQANELLALINQLAAERPPPPPPTIEAPEPEVGAFDPAVLMRQAGNDPTLACEVARIFLEDCPMRTASIEQALTTGNLCQLEIAAHTIKGLLVNFAPGSAAQIAAEIERCAKEQRLADALKLWPLFEQQSRAMCAAVGHWLERS